MIGAIRGNSVTALLKISSSERNSVNGASVRPRSVWSEGIDFIQPEDIEAATVDSPKLSNNNYMVLTSALVQFPVQNTVAPRACAGVAPEVNNNSVRERFNSSTEERFLDISGNFLSVDSEYTNNMSDMENVVDSDCNEISSERRSEETNVPVTGARTGLGAANEVKNGCSF